MRQDELRQLIYNGEIRNAVLRANRGLDRGDPGLMLQSFTSSTPTIPTHGFTRLSNMWIVIDGDRGWSETYVISGGPGALHGGRYLDRHARMEDGWKIEDRRYISDWSTLHEAAASNGSIDNAASFSPVAGQGSHDPAPLLHALAKARAATLLPEADPTMTQSTTAAQVDALLSHQALHTLMVTYCRAVDRGDSDLLASIFHHDAIVIAGMCNGPAHDFARDVTGIIRANLAMCFHSVANEWFDVDGDHAVGESYVIAFNRTNDAEAPQESMVAGRYVDRFERRQGTWKISERVFVEDWRSTRAAPALATRSNEREYGCFGRDDPIYRFWPDSGPDSGRAT